MPSNDTLAERIARMEQRLDHIDLAEAKHLYYQQEMSSKIDDLTLEIGKYKGFIGGVLVIVSCLWAFVKMGIPYILKLTGKQ